LGLKLLSTIARALDDDKFLLLSSLDWHSAFDVVNVQLLMKRFAIIGRTSDLISLIGFWLKKQILLCQIQWNQFNYIQSAPRHCAGMNNGANSICHFCVLY
jgi:hypothetical protein